MGDLGTVSVMEKNTSCVSDLGIVLGSAWILSLGVEVNS